MHALLDPAEGRQDVERDDEPRFAALCHGHRDDARGRRRGVRVDRPRWQPGGDAPRWVVDVPESGFYSFRVHGSGDGRWLANRSAIAFLDPTALGIDVAPKRVALERGRNELSAELAPGAAIERIELVPVDDACIAPRGRVGCRPAAPLRREGAHARADPRARGAAADDRGPDRRGGRALPGGRRRRTARRRAAGRDALPGRLGPGEGRARHLRVPGERAGRRSLQPPGADERPRASGLLGRRSLGGGGDTAARPLGCGLGGSADDPAAPWRTHDPRARGERRRHRRAASRPAPHARPGLHRPPRVLRRPGGRGRRGRHRSGRGAEPRGRGLRSLPARSTVGRAVARRERGRGALQASAVPDRSREFPDASSHDFDPAVGGDRAPDRLDRRGGGRAALRAAAPDPHRGGLGRQRVPAVERRARRLLPPLPARHSRRLERGARSRPASTSDSTRACTSTNRG